MKRLIKYVLITILLLIVTFFIVLNLVLDKIIHAGVETIGPKLTRSEIRLDEVNISPLNGSGALKGLFIGNPEGFKSDKAFFLGEIEIDIAPLSLFSERVLIKKIYIREPQIVFESSAKGNNLNQLLKNINEWVTLSEGEEDEEVKFEITNFILEEGSVEINIPGKTKTISVPKIEFHDMGKESGGITSDELVKEILGGVTFNVELKVRDVAGLAVGKGVGVGVEVTKKGTGVAEETVKGVKKLFNNVKPGK